VEDHDACAVVCDRVLALYGRLKGTLSEKGNNYTAGFERQDLINIKVGKILIFTVCIIAENVAFNTLQHQI
jgi:hypothetical protein